MKKILYVVLVSSGMTALSMPAWAQKAPDTVLQQATLSQVVDFALKHYPLVQQALLDEQITDRQIRSKLADWYPQLNLNANYQHNFQLQSIYFNGNYVRTGVNNTSLIGLGLTQNLFNRDVLLASKTKNDALKLSRQVTATDKIDLVVNVSKAFYDVLLTQQQIVVLNDDIRRLERNLKDTYNQYQGGLVDKTDYKRATISLNNSRAELKTNQEGKAVIDVIPVDDVVRLQIIAKGFQTYGQDYTIDKPSLAMEIRMKRPGEQYSIYKDHPDQDQNQDGDKPKDGAKPDDKPAPHSK